MSGKKKHETVASPVAVARVSGRARSHVVRIRTGRMECTESTMRTLVRACRQLTTEPVRAADMFDLGEDPASPPADARPRIHAAQDDPHWNAIVLYSFRHAASLQTDIEANDCAEFLAVFWATLAPATQEGMLATIGRLARQPTAPASWRRLHAVLCAQTPMRDT